VRLLDIFLDPWEKLRRLPGWFGQSPLVKRRKLLIRFTCSNTAHHEHRWWWSARLCGWLQWYTTRLLGWLLP